MIIFEDIFGWTLIEISVSIISYASLVYKIIRYVSDMARYPKLVFIGLYLVLTYIKRLISTVCDFFSYFRMSIICRNWVCKLHNIFLTYTETEANSMFEGF